MDRSDRWFETKFWEALEEMEGDPREAVRRLERFNASQLSAPLRSWALVVRAGDSRIRGERGDWRLANGDWLEKEVVRLDRGEIIRLCAPVEIPWPGASVGEAARRLGVAKKTIWEWTREKGCRDRGTEGLRGEEIEGHLRGGKVGGKWRTGEVAKWRVGDMGEPKDYSNRHPVGRLVRRRGRVLVRDVYVNLADRKRDEVRVWAYAGVDPNGEVFAGPWGTVRKRLVERVGEEWEQEVVRERREIGRRDRGTKGPRDQGGRARWGEEGEFGQWGWECGRCGAWVHKLYWPMTPWTVVASAVGLEWQAGAAWREGFACRRCAGLVYESSERQWAKGKKGAEIFWRRFVRRMMGGVK